MKLTPATIVYVLIFNRAFTLLTIHFPCASKTIDKKRTQTNLNRKIHAQNLIRHILHFIKKMLKVIQIQKLKKV